MFGMRMAGLCQFYWRTCVLSFFTWYICTAQWPTSFTKFWAWSAKRGKLGARTCPRRRGFFVSITRRLFGNFATADFHQIWPWHVNRGWNADFWQKFMKSFHLGVICPQNAKLGGVKQAPHSEQATGQRMHCRVMLFTLRCISMAREFLSSGEFFCITYGSGATGQSKLPNFRILAYFPHTKRLKSTFRWPAYSPEVTLQNDSDFTVWQSKVQRVRQWSFPVTSARGAVDPQIFVYGKWLYPYKMLLHGASDLDQRCLKMCRSAVVAFIGGDHQISLPSPENCT